MCQDMSQKSGLFLFSSLSLRTLTPRIIHQMNQLQLRHKKLLDAQAPIVAQLLSTLSRLVNLLGQKDSIPASPTTTFALHACAGGLAYRLHTAISTHMGHADALLADYKRVHAACSGLRDTVMLALCGPGGTTHAAMRFASRVDAGLVRLGADVQRVEESVCAIKEADFAGAVKLVADLETRLARVDLR